MQQLALEEAEALRMTIVGQNDLAGRHHAFRRLDHPRATHLLERQRRRLLIHPHRAFQCIGKTPHIGRWLDHHRARHEHA
ncbi:hypothetical protein D3C80_2015300 [compost metagenome]